ncbi:ABC transporter ATP-binding protein [Corynebacterium sp.]|uniref:ABC transporter ATP-binding protein n=1 Tax=Corynebacterium sp. TaxID=1720 RepID=UPI0026DA8845|nr:ABC transporter ATP-binding protein [Corynebacterium sp.]MDO5075984.1 ABC transporter ATP-binding protein [Corynebacterium sp.]
MTNAVSAAETPTESHGAHVNLTEITKSYGSTEIIAPTSVRIFSGEFVSILGPSGCGKSTILSMIAGLAFPTTGTVFAAGHPVTAPGPDRGMVFQHHALLPWMTAKGNIEFGLKSARPELGPAERSRIADRFLAQVGLAHAATRRPARLSGGMQQRVGLARAFAVDPDILLLDEPFGALDALTRRELQLQLRSVWEANKRTVIMVTHDVDEAITLSDRILVMSHGPSATVIADLDVGPSPDHTELREHLLELLEHSPKAPATLS